MTILIKEDDFIRIHCEPAQKYLLARWKPQSMHISEAYFKEINQIYLKSVQDYRLNYLVINAQHFGFPITPDIQEWVATQIVPQAIAAGLSKMAFVMSSDFIAQLSIEQTMEEAKEKAAFEMRYFDSEDKAITWFGV